MSYDEGKTRNRDGSRGRDRKPFRNDSEDGRRDSRPRDGRRDFKPRNRDDGKRDFKPRDRDDRRSGNGRDLKSGNGKKFGDRKYSGDRRDKKPVHEFSDKPRFEDSKESLKEEKTVVHNERKLSIPSTAQKILFKGVDFEENGKTDTALALYLHGIVLLSGGCEKNALRILRNAGRDEFDNVRERIADRCSEDALIVFDRLCYSLNSDYPTPVLDKGVSEGNPVAIYSKILLEELDGEDASIDVFVNAVDDKEEMVVNGLKLLVRKKDSVKAENHLKNLDNRKKKKQSLRGTFIKAMKGESYAVRELEKLSDEFKEAAFYKGYLTAHENGESEEYLRDNMESFRDVILSTASEFGISDTAYGKYLRAKRIQTNDGDWVHSMVAAYKAGSQEALEELRPVQTRKDVKASLETICLQKGDVEGLVRFFDGEDTACLDKYCSADPQRVIEVGRLLGGAREIDWLKRGFRNGNEACKDVLLSMVDDESRHGKLLVYALHDVGAELESAKLYFRMGDDPSLPSVKWLAKVCSDEEAKEYVRQQFEAKGDLETFESIFIEDGYKPKYSGKGRNNGGFRKGGKGRR